MNKEALKAFAPEASKGLKTEHISMTFGS